jgi:hypothetical protein
VSEDNARTPIRRSGDRARVLVALVIIVIIGVSGIWSAGWVRSNYANPERFYVHSLPPASRTPAISERVVLVVSDGLRDDIARQLPNISSLARRPDSVFRRSVTGVPSLSRPGSISLLCGSGPTESGFPLNESKGEVSVECLFDTVADAGLSSVVAGVGEGFAERFHPPNTELFARNRSDDVSAYVPDDIESFQLSRQALERRASFAYLYFPDVDEESHLNGSISRQALDAATVFDGFVGEIAKSLDFSKDTLIVTSDHGHRDEGGHGGYEWLVRRSPVLMVGRGISGGSTADIAQADIAPTIAALLGVSRPRHAEGMPLLDDLDATLDLKQIVFDAHEAALRRKLQADLESLSGSPAPSGEVDVLRQQIAESGWSRGVREAVRRIPWAALLLAGLALSMALAGGWRRHALAGGSVGAAVFCLGVWASGWRLTISQFNVPSDETRLTWALLGSAAAGVLVGTVVSKLFDTSANERGLSFSRHVVGTTSVLQGIAGLIVAWMLVYYGLKYSWRLPDLRLGLATFWGMYAAGFAAATAVLLVGLSWLVAASRRKPPAEVAVVSTPDSKSAEDQPGDEASKSKGTDNESASGLQVGDEE